MNSFNLIIIRSQVDKDMFDHIRGGVPQNPNKDTCVIAVETPGGDPMFAFRTMELLNKKYKKVYFVIMDMAMSAGTLMALGADKIYLAAGACLGPLDLQMQHPTDDWNISTLDIRDTASATAFEAATVFHNVFVKNLNNGIPKTMAAKMASDVVVDLYKPIMDKIDPYRLHESLRNSSLSIAYSKKLLSSRMLKQNNDKEISRISYRLTNKYPAHDYSIMLDEAREMGLIVEEAEKLDRYDDIRTLYNSVSAGQNLSMAFYDVNEQENKDSVQAKKDERSNKKW